MEYTAVVIRGHSQRVHINAFGGKCRIEGIGHRRLIRCGSRNKIAQGQCAHETCALAK